MACILQEMRGRPRDWRAAISSPLTYRIGSSTLHFRSHLLLTACLVVLALLTLLHLSTSSILRSSTHSNGLSKLINLHNLPTVRKTNSTYPLTPVKRIGAATQYR